MKKALTITDVEDAKKLLRFSNLLISMENCKQEHICQR